MSDGPLRWGEREPGRVAIRCGERTLSYGELRARALAVAGEVSRELGDRRQQPVGIRTADPVALLATFLGVVEAGAIAVPFSASWPERELAAAITACTPVLWVGDAAGDRGGVLRGADQAAGPQDRGPRSGDALFYVGFSSGSTAAPKAIARSHSAWLNSFLAMGVELGVHADTHVAVPGPLASSFSLIAALQALFVGAELRLPASAGVRAMPPMLAGEGTVLYALPSALEALARHAGRRERCFPGVTAVICAGEKLPPATREAAAGTFPRAEVIEYYGASELGYVTVARAEDAAARPGSVGRPFPGSEVAILGPGGEPLPRGQVGLLCARTEYGFAGYWGDARGALAIDHFGWATAGDLAWQDDDGYVHLAGRRDTMLVLKGENVFPERTEQVLLAVRGVRDAAVAGEPADAPDHLVALVAVDADGPGAGELLQVCRRQLPPVSVPRRVEIAGSLPRTAAGKLARAEIGRLVRRANRGGGDDR